jgi:hypothetical protein
LQERRFVLFRANEQNEKVKPLALILPLKISTMFTEPSKSPTTIFELRNGENKKKTDKKIKKRENIWVLTRQIEDRGHRCRKHK